jgi:hypothetical protein
MHIDVRLDGRKLRVVIIEKSILDDKKGAECHAKIEAETGSLKDREISCRLKDYQRLNKDCTARSLFRLHVFWESEICPRWRSVSLLVWREPPGLLSSFLVPQREWGEKGHIDFLTQ